MTVEIIDVFRFMLLPLLLLYIGYNEKSKTALSLRLSEAVSRTELERAVNQAKEIQAIQNIENKEDIKRLEGKVDRLLERP